MFRYLVLAALFFVLSPGNFFTLPRGGSKRTVALVHAALFVVAYYLSEKVAEMLMVKESEGFQYEKRFKVSGNPMKRTWGKTASKSDKLKNAWNNNAAYCERMTKMKDEEYEKYNNNPGRYRGNFSERLEELEIMQADACDEANYSRNALSGIGITW